MPLAFGSTPVRAIVDGVLVHENVGLRSSLEFV